MYIQRKIRTQLYLDEAIHRHPPEVARRRGLSISELVRDALARTYGA
jgi:hypothetical protein